MAPLAPVAGLGSCPQRSCGPKAGYPVLCSTAGSVPGAAWQQQAKPADEGDAGRSLWVAGTASGSARCLACTYDTYGGVIVDPGGIPRETDEFRRLMSASLEVWRSEGRHGVWLEIGTPDACLISVATSEFGFEFHHAEPGHAMLTKWLPSDRPNTLPGNASHTVGVGAMVLDQKAGKVLLVREKNGPAAVLDIWKLPTGLVDAGEELHEAAAREVLEETGVIAKFQDVRAFRTSHVGNLAHKGKSNLFFIVRLQADSTTPLREQHDEIAEAKWFTLEEYDALPFPARGTTFDLLNRSALNACAAYEAKELSSGPRRGKCWVYFPTAVEA